MAEARQRLDQLLTGRGLSRSRAADAIRRGTVTVDGIVAARPAQMVGAGADVVLSAEADRYVSRAGLKLAHALDHFGFDPAGCCCLDIGASTGGFTQVLLERGAAKVFAVDVGHGQLAAALAADPRVVDLEGTDARRLDGTLVPAAPDFIVADVSFIGLEKALPAALALAAPAARLVVLVKPQFEAGPNDVGKDGVVRDGAVRDAAVGRIAGWLEGAGWSVEGRVPSPVPGKTGNIEWLIAARRDARR